MREIALHILDISENSVNAGATRIEILVIETIQQDRLIVIVNDNGKGMDALMLANVTDPFVTTRTTRKIGLGIPLFKAAAEACNGNLAISSSPGKGTRLEAQFQRSHIDRMPLGDLSGTILNLIIGYPAINWVFSYQSDDTTFTFDDAPIKAELEDIPLTEPGVLSFIKDRLQSGIADVRQTLIQAETR